MGKQLRKIKRGGINVLRKCIAKAGGYYGSEGMRVFIGGRELKPMTQVASGR